MSTIGDFDNHTSGQNIPQFKNDKIQAPAR